jgi:hypothetical protein
MDRTSIPAIPCTAASDGEHAAMSPQLTRVPDSSFLVLVGNTARHIRHSFHAQLSANASRLGLGRLHGDENAALP